MLKKNYLLKRFLILIGALIIIIFIFVIWFMSLLSSGVATSDLKNTKSEDLPYLTERVPPSRGKILAVVTSCGTIGNSDKSTGYEHTELARAYYVFIANGFEVEVASPLGGKPSVVIDWDDMGLYDYAFLNDKVAQRKVNHTIALEDVNNSEYQAVYFVGGKGAIFDFPENTKIQNIVKEFNQEGKVIGAVCHGPAALINVTLEDGKKFLENKRVTSFTNDEEVFLIPDAKTIFPFLLQDKLISQGAHFEMGQMYLQNITKDGNLVTGQNPWSTWTLAEAIIQQLGYVPKERLITAEENTIKVLNVYATHGPLQAKKKIKDILSHQQDPIDRKLLAMHSLVAAMQWKIEKSIDLISLLSYAKDQSKSHH